MKDLRKIAEEMLERMFDSKTEQQVQETKLWMHEQSQQLTPEERAEVGRIHRDLMCERRKKRGEKRTDVDMKNLLGDVGEVISLSYIAKHYFKKDRTWLYHRINGTIINGCKSAFTDDELKIFRFALDEIGAKISGLSVSIN